VKQIQISETELIVSGVCLGTYPFGMLITEKDSFNLMDAFIHEGGNFFDSAYIYGTWIKGIGCMSESEKTIGKWLNQTKKRDKVILNTKGGSLNLDTWHYQSSKEEILSQLDNSLKNLQTDYIDIYWLHRDDPGKPVSFYIDLLNDQVKRGKVRYIGCSNWTVDRITEANEYAKKNGMMGFIANQPWWSLAKPNFDEVSDKTMVWLDEDGIDFHQKTGKTLIPYSSQAKGFFSILDAVGENGMSESIKKLYLNEQNLRVFKKLKYISAETGQTISDIVISFLTNQDFPVIPIVGSDTKEQITAICGAIDIQLTKEMRELIKVSISG
jgi:aryl-alcohol dehydrogenase-like predicted oxidoreductase